MTIANLFHTVPGMYATQSFLHALIAMILTDMSIQTWKIEDPSVRQRLRYAVILIAVFSFPAYQLINPERGSVFVRSAALFDSSQWLSLEPFGLFSLRVPFLLLLGAASLVFLFQELIPVIRHTFERNENIPGEGGPEDEARVAELLASLPGPRPRVVLLDDDDLALFSSSGKNASVYISTGLLRALSPAQARAALAHEAAHLGRNRRPVLVAVFFLRMLSFFNPVVLIEFRRAVRGEEKICDDIAVARTNDPKALAETLRLFTPRASGGGAPDDGEGAARLSLEEYGHNLQIESRVARLEQDPRPLPDRGLLPSSLTVAAAVAINYFVV